MLNSTNQSDSDLIFIIINHTIHKYKINFILYLSLKVLIIIQLTIMVINGCHICDPHTKIRIMSPNKLENCFRFSGKFIFLRKNPIGTDIIKIAT